LPAKNVSLDRSGRIGGGGFRTTKKVRARSPPEFEEEAGRLVLGGQTVSSTAKTFCLSDPTPDNRRKAEAAAGLRALTGKAAGVEQRAIARPKAEPAKPRTARDILKKSGGVCRASVAAGSASIARHRTVRPSAPQCRVCKFPLVGARGDRR
jgi:transposase-like protein